MATVQKEAPDKPRLDGAKLLIAVVALGLSVPVAAGFAWLVLGDRDGPERTDRQVDSASREADEGSPSTDLAGEEPRAPSPRPRSPSEETEPRGESMHGPGTSPAAREDAARIARFDDNALSFDERLSRFQEEGGATDAEAANAVRVRIQSDVDERMSGVIVTPHCSRTVCVVELTSDESVGTLIARLAPWFRELGTAATGDPIDPDDTHGMRLVFEKEEVPGLAEQ